MIILNTDNAIAEEKGLAIYHLLLRSRLKLDEHKSPDQGKNLTDTTQEAEILIKPFRMGKDERLELILQKIILPRFQNS